ncbi:MAG: hypothetical protein WC402_04450 [Candidatus Pacearchaeota archaeon]|jgi:hypothetical protein
MGIQVEFNPDLALRKFKTIKRLEAECLPESLEKDGIYPFLKKGQRNYWLHGEIPLKETKGNQELSRPIASIRILEATHFLIKGELYTKGEYQVIETFDPNDTKSKFEGYERTK